MLCFATELTKDLETGRTIWASLLSASVSQLGHGDLYLFLAVSVRFGMDVTLGCPRPVPQSSIEIGGLGSGGLAGLEEGVA